MPQPPPCTAATSLDAHATDWLPLERGRGLFDLISPLQPSPSTKFPSLFVSSLWFFPSSPGLFALARTRITIISPQNTRQFLLTHVTNLGSMSAEGLPQ